MVCRGVTKNKKISVWGIMGELMKKKGVRIGFAIICIAVIVVAAGTAVRSGNRKRAITEHMESAQKYIDGLDYEQAIAEYLAVFEIDPRNSEVRETLVNTYLVYADSLGEEGDYVSAISLLQRGYEQTQAEILQEKMDSIKVIEFQFELADFDVLGCSILEKNYWGNLQEEIKANKQGYPSGYELENNWKAFLSDDIVIIQNYNDMIIFNCWDSGYRCFYHDKDRLEAALNKADISNISSAPVMLGITYQQWEDLMKIEKIRNIGNMENEDLEYGNRLRYTYDSQFGESQYIEIRYKNGSSFNSYVGFKFERGTEYINIDACFNKSNRLTEWSVYRAENDMAGDIVHETIE